MVTEYAYVMCKGFPAETAEALADDLYDVIKIENNLIGNTTAKTIYENAKKALKAVEIPDKIIDSVIMKPEELIQQPTMKELMEPPKISCCVTTSHE